MSRNKYPEQTKKRILDAAEILFMDNGYDNTTIQDIINELGGMTKGAVYHHFKSKEEILIEIVSQPNQVLMDSILAIKNSIQWNGLEKLKKTLALSITEQNSVLRLCPNYMKTPQLLIFSIENIFAENVPCFVQPLIEEGMRDGSIKTNYPKELGEVLILLANIWMNPLVTKSTREESKRKCEFYRELLARFDIDILDDEMMKSLEKFFDLYYKQNKSVHCP